MAYSREQVRAKARVVFPNRDLDAVMAELDVYGAEPDEPDRERVQLAILKLSEEQKLDSPASYVDAAKQDYRDVLAWAEYPSQMDAGPNTGTDPTGVQRNRELDEQQYQAWLSAR